MAYKLNFRGRNAQTQGSQTVLDSEPQVISLKIVLNISSGDSPQGPFSEKLSIGTQGSTVFIKTRCLRLSY